MSRQCFEDFDFTLDFALLNGFKCLDNDLLIQINSDTRIYFRVLTFADFGNDLVTVDVAECKLEYPYSISYVS